ncbi:MAG: hypothetical protein ACKV1O_17035 [Saprospiraceae bacterium]
MPDNNPFERNSHVLTALNAKLSPFVNKTNLWLLSEEGKKKGMMASQLVGTALMDNAGTYSVPTLDQAEAFAEILKRHPAVKTGKDWSPTGSYAYLEQFAQGGESDPSLALESVALVFGGLQALASLNADMAPYYESLLMIAVGADELSLKLRRQITGLIPGWKSPIPPTGLPSSFITSKTGLECIGAMRQGLGAAGNWFAYSGSAKLPNVDASGIKAISPNFGGAGTPVTLTGSFPPVEPPQTFIVFTSQDEKPVLSPIDEWSSTEIKTKAPERVGDGPVAIITFDGNATQGNPGEALQFADILTHCLGAGVAPIADHFASQVLNSLEIKIPNPPLQPGGVNVFHGGPILTHVLTPEIHHGDVVRVEGKNLLHGDIIAVDGFVCATQMIGPSILEGRVLNLGVRGGLRSVQIVRGTSGSQTSLIRMLPGVTQLRTPRGQPGGTVLFDGTCFPENDLNATLNGEAASVRFSTATEISVSVFVPKQNPPPRNPDGEVCEIILYDRGKELGRFPVILETYRIVSLGDSVMWGQGLLENQKFTELVGQSISLSPSLSNGRSVYRQDRSANSGAKILNFSNDPADFACSASPSFFDVAPPGTPVNFEGEKNCGASSVSNQARQWASIPIEIRNRVSLVLVDGGINDFGVTNLFDPFLSATDLERRVSFCCNRMRDILLENPGTPSAQVTSVRVLFPNATIIVTGYFPVISADTNLFQLIELVISLGFVPAISVFSAGVIPILEVYRSRLITISRVFVETANRTLAAAVQDTNDPRVRFAAPVWRDENCVFASDPYLFALQFPLEPEDPVAENRKAICGTPCLNSNPGQPPNEPGAKCSFASLGHPNAKGARAYADAIMEVL